MMKKLVSLVIISLAWLLPGLCFAQANLVYNGSFEELSKCPAGALDFPFARGWRILMGTPDLFASCVPNSGALAVPINFNGTRATFSGDNYVGIALNTLSGAFSKKTNYLINEAIYTHTLKTLKTGKHYKLSFLISLADSAVFRTDSLYCSFSSSPPVAAKGIKGVLGRWYKLEKSDDYSCALTFTCVGCWNLVEVEFTAKQDYNYLAVGLPRAHYTPTMYTRDLATPVRPLSKSKWVQMSAYYYLDDIQLFEK